MKLSALALEEKSFLQQGIKDLTLQFLLLMKNLCNLEPRASKTIIQINSAAIFTCHPK
jgi:hypothetical protein